MLKLKSSELLLPGVELPMIELPTEDGIPLETNWHRMQMNLLIESVHYHWREREPTGNELLGWRHEGGEYATIEANEQGRLWSEELGLWLGNWQGEFQRLTTTWLRLYTPEGELVPIMSESAAQRAAVLARRAKVAAQRAETKAQRAKIEAQRATTEAQRAATEAQRAKAEAQRAETEARRAEKAEAEVALLRARLASLGVDNENAPGEV